MRNFIDIINASLLNEARKVQPTILKEFADNGKVLDLDSAVSYLSYYLGQKLYRVGGPARVYEVDGGAYGAVYVVGQSSVAVGLSWPSKSAGIRAIYVWPDFSLFKAPEYCFDIPKTDFESIAPTLARLIKNPKTGQIEINLNESSRITEGVKRRASEGMFLDAIAKWASENKKDMSKISIADLNDVSDETGYQIPGDIRNDRRWKTGRIGMYDFSSMNGGGGGSANDEETKKINSTISNILGQDIASAIPDDEGAPDETWDTALSLAKATQMRKLVAQGKIFITGRKNGKFFSIPKGMFDQILAMVERMMAQQLADTSQSGDDEGKTQMEIEYEDLLMKVRHIAGGKSTTVQSLLITGSPSSGKSFSVMNTIKNELGLKEGKDYVYKKGSVTVPAMYRILIEQANGGLAIFDDCDSVLTDGDGLNMLKGALDTDNVREVSFDKARGIVNTAVMPEEERDAYVTRLSELLRGKTPALDDVNFFKKYVPLRALKQTKAEAEDDANIEAAQIGEGGYEDYNRENEDGDEDDDSSYLSNRQSRIIEYVKNNLPNKIDFKGRIIFISNMSQEDFASQGKGSGAAILSRAFYVNLTFTSGQMLDFIEGIQTKIPFKTLTDEEKAETIQYLRERYSSGALKSDVNFRVVIIAFEYRAMGKEGGNWKRLINSL